MNLLPARNPVVRVWDNPLAQVDAKMEELYEYQPIVGLQYRELIPKGCARAVLIVNDQPLMQREWHRPVAAGDVIEWHVLSSGQNASRTILTIVAMIAIYFILGPAGLGLTGTQLAVATVVLNLAASALINALIPLKAADGGLAAESPGSVYNGGLAGNQARLNQPIPVLYGRNRSYPDFAAQPYVYFFGNNQFYCALLCVGQGEYAFEAIQIDDTPIDNFHAVYYKVLHPGEQPARVIGNMVTAIEVAGNQLDYNTPIGGFVLCKPRQQVKSISYDLSCDQGLVKYADDGSNDLLIKKITVQVDIQYVDDFGVPLSDWQAFDTQTVSAKTKTPQRWTFSKDLAVPGRPLVRITRETPFDEGNNVINVITWTGLRGQLTVDAPLCSTATYIEVVIKANEQLNGSTQKKINVITRRKLPIWNGTSWSGPVETRSPAWAQCDAWKNATYGDGLLDTDIDLETMLYLDGVWAARQDHLDIIFDSRVTSKDASRTMMQAGRAVAFQRMGVFSVCRDELAPAPLTMFSTRDIVPGSTSIGYALVTPETADAITLEYFDGRSWDWTPITVLVPGVTTSVRPVIIRVMGISGSMQALREATFMAAVNLYRRKFPTWQTEMKGVLPAYGSPVIFSPALPNWGKGGDVVAWTAAAKTVRLSEPAVFVPGKNHFITLEKPNGSLSIAIPATPGATPNDVVLSLDPGFTPITNDPDRERTKYVFGPEGQHQVIVRLTRATGKGRSEEGNPIVELSGVAENNLVHLADNAYLPTGGIQDPVPTTVVGEASLPENDPNNPEVGPLMVHVTTQVVQAGLGGLVGEDVDESNYGGGVSLKFNADGTFTSASYDGQAAYLSHVPTRTESYAGQWLNRAPEPGVTSQYEIYVTAQRSFPDQYSNPNTGIVDGPYNTWLNLGTTRTFTFGSKFSENLGGPDASTPMGAVGCQFTTQIRKVGQTILLANTYHLVNITTSFGSGSGEGGEGADA